MVNYTKETLTFKKLYNYLKKGTVVIPEYQRGSAWSMPQKKLLVDSILRDIDVPKIYLRKTKTPDGALQFDLMDGQQRLTALSEFVESKYKTHQKINPYPVHDIRGLYFHKLEDDVQDSIWDYTFDCVIYDENTNDKFIKEMFLRLQNGRPLNAAEKRRAMDTNLTHIIMETVKTHPAFTILGYKNTRSKYEHLLATMYLQMRHIKQKGLVDQLEFRQSSAGVVATMYKELKDIEDSDPIVIHVNRALDTFYELYKNSNISLRAGYTLDAIILSHWINLNMPQWRGRAKEIVAKLDRFEEDRLKYLALPEEEKTQHDPMIVYSNALRSTDPLRLSYRHNTLLNLIK